MIEVRLGTNWYVLRIILLELSRQNFLSPVTVPPKLKSPYVNCIAAYYQKFIAIFIWYVSKLSPKLNKVQFRWLVLERCEVVSINLSKLFQEKDKIKLYLGYIKKKYFRYRVSQKKVQ